MKAGRYTVINLKEIKEFLYKNGRHPHEYLVDKFSTYDVILLAEDHCIKQNLLFIQDMIPKLYSAGVYNLGMEFGASEDQSILDELITGDYYDEELARRLMFNYNVAWPYKEYMEVYRKAWEFNRSLAESDRKFRILNISYKYDWWDFNGRRTPDNYGKVFHKGNIEGYRVGLIEREVIEKNEKLLVLTGSVHAFTHYKFPEFDGLEENFCRYNNKFMGNLLYKKYPGKVCTIWLHQAFRNKNDNEYKQVSPAEGAIEKIMREAQKYPVAFDLVNSPLGKLRDSSYYSTGYPDFSLEQLAQGYILLARFKDMEGCSVDYDFLKDQKWKEVIRQYPDPDWHGGKPESIEVYWKRIEQYANNRYGHEF
jgi:hypothetical protein